MLAVLLPMSRPLLMAVSWQLRAMLLFAAVGLSVVSAPSIHSPKPSFFHTFGLIIRPRRVKSPL